MLPYLYTLKEEEEKNAEKYFKSCLLRAKFNKYYITLLKYFT